MEATCSRLSGCSLGKSGSLDAILRIIAVVLVIAGMVAILRRLVLLGSSLSSLDSSPGRAR
jgi:hypothetical protein